MASVLLSALAGLGAAEHALSIAEALRVRGHRVSVVTSALATDRYRRAGFEVHVVPEPAAPDGVGEPAPLAQRMRRLLARVQRTVVEPIPEQWAVVERVIRDAAVDVVVTDGLLGGAAMLAVRPAAMRPPVIMLGFSPPWVPDPTVPPYGLGYAPSEAAGNRVRAAGFELLAARATAVVSRTFNAQIERTFGVRLRGDLRTTPAYADVWAQLATPRFEYPRTTLPPGFRFVGPVHPAPDDPVPSWWSPLEEPPVVAVRAGSPAAIDGLVVPTVRAFGHSGSTIVVAGVERPAVEAAFPAPLPPNVHFEARLPWSRLIAQRTVVVSDGDYLHTQHALRHGIPVVVADGLAAGMETAARVAWSGAGIDLRTGRPTSAAIHAAVQRIRGDDAFRTAAARIASQIATTDAEGTICDLVDEQVAARRGPGSVGREPDPGQLLRQRPDALRVGLAAEGGPERLLGRAAADVREPVGAVEPPPDRAGAGAREQRGQRGGLRRADQDAAAGQGADQP